MNDAFVGTSFFKRFLGSGAQMTDHIDLLSAIGQESEDVINTGADGAGEYLRHMLFYLARVFLE